MEPRLGRRCSSFFRRLPTRRWDERRSLNFYMRAYGLALAVIVGLAIASPWPWLAALPFTVALLTGLLVPGKHNENDQQAK
jgi:fatty acid desaturase